MSAGFARKWTAEEKLRVVFLFNNGHSASQIAREYGVSRNAILGLVHRARHQTSGAVRSRSRSRRRDRRDTGRKTKPRQLKPRPISHAPDEDPVPFLERADTQCVYPLWQDDAPPEKLFEGLVCGAPVRRTRMTQPAYCAHHQAVCGRPVEPLV